MKPEIRTKRNYLENLKNCLLFLVGVFLCIQRPVFSAGAKCGRPGRTTISIYEPPGNEFNEHDIIRYICTEYNHTIIGSSERLCLKNGTWSGEIPVCSKVASLENVDLMFQDSESGKNNTIDGDISTCSQPSKYNRTIWIGYLPTSANISAVQISILGIREVDLDVTIQDINSTSTQKCKLNKENAEFIPKASRRTLIFYCPASTVGKYVHISCNNQSVRFCEVSVLLPPVSSCLSPDIPLHGNGYKRFTETESEYQFNCHIGYKRWGALTATCQGDGRWNPKSPSCEEIYCYAPEDIENGYVEFYLNNGRIPYNGTARYTCNEGFYLSGKPVIRCQRWEQWDFASPICKPRITENVGNTKYRPVTESWRQTNVSHCGNLPHIANGALIVNSSNVGSFAWLKCTEGFKPLTDDHIICLPNGKWSSQSLHCTIIQCEVKPDVPHGTAILLQNSTYYGSYLEIKCDKGFASRTMITRKCNEFGTWGDLNICVEITCGALNPDETQIGQWLPVNGSTSLHVLICPENFHIEGSPAVIHCLSNGSWSFTTAKCEKSFSSLWGNNWTPSLMLIAAVAAGVATAIVILCLSVAFLVLKKRRQAQTNTTVFHLQNVCHKDRMEDAMSHRQKHHSAVEAYNTVEHRPKSVCTNPRKPCSALPNLPIDADPVYAQPFEIAVKKPSITNINKKDDLYNTHIYAEPVDSRRHTPTHILINLDHSRTGTYSRSSVMRKSFANDPLESVTTDQQNCDKKCAIYDTSANPNMPIVHLANDDKLERVSDKNKFGTLTQNLEYLELL